MKLIKKYENVIEEIREEFLKIYYLDEDEVCTDWFWVGDEIGGVLYVCDDFWSVEDIINAMKYNPTKEQLTDYYYNMIDTDENVQKYNMKVFINLNK